MLGMWLLLGGMASLYGAFWQWQAGNRLDGGVAGTGVVLAVWGVVALAPRLRGLPVALRVRLAVAAAGSAWLVAVGLWAVGAGAGKLRDAGVAAWAAMSGRVPAWEGVTGLLAGVWQVVGKPHVEILLAAGSAGSWARELGLPLFVGGGLWVLAWAVLVVAPLVEWEPWSWWRPRWQLLAPAVAWFRLRRGSGAPAAVAPVAPVAVSAAPVAQDGMMRPALLAILGAPALLLAGLQVVPGVSGVAVAAPVAGLPQSVPVSAGALVALGAGLGAAGAALVPVVWRHASAAAAAYRRRYKPPVRRGGVTRRTKRVGVRRSGSVAGGGAGQEPGAGPVAIVEAAGRAGQRG